LCPSLFATNVHLACALGEAWAVGPSPGDMAGVAYWLWMPEGEVTLSKRRSLATAPMPRPGERRGTGSRRWNGVPSRQSAISRIAGATSR
jgi:hypothetical protein